MGFIDNFLKGRAIAEQEHEHAQNQDYEKTRRKLEIDQLQHQAKALKIADALQQLQLHPAAPETTVSRPQPQTMPYPGQEPGIAEAMQAQNASSAGTAQVEHPLPSVTIPFESGPQTVPQTSLQQELRRQLGTREAEAAIAESHAPPTVIPEGSAATGGRLGGTIVTNPKSAPEPTGELKEFKEIGLPGYAAKLGKPVSQLTDQEKAAAFSEFVRSKQQPRLLTPAEEAQQMRIRKASNIAGLPPQAQTRVQSLAAQFDSNPVIKNFNESVTKLQTVKGLLDAHLGGPGDLAIVYEFMKGLDPTSVVRESEYAAAAKSGNIFSGALAKFNGYLKAEGGFLPPNVKDAFYKIVQMKIAASSTQVKRMYDDFGRRVDLITGQPGTGTQYLTDYTQGLDTGAGGAGNAGNPYR